MTILEETFKSKTKFEDLMVNSPMPEVISDVLKNYPTRTVERIADLTQNFETFLNTVGNKVFDADYLVWIITNEKEKIMNTLQVINQNPSGFGDIFSPPRP